MCCGVFVVRVCVTVVGLVRSSFLCSWGQRFVVAIYACALTCAHAVVLLCLVFRLSCSVFELLSLFSHTFHSILLLTLFILLFYYQIFIFWYKASTGNTFPVGLVKEPGWSILLMHDDGHSSSYTHLFKPCRNRLGCSLLFIHSLVEALRKQAILFIALRKQTWLLTPLHTLT